MFRRHSPLGGLLAACLIPSVLFFAATPHRTAFAQQPSGFNAQSVPVFISDFELHAVSGGTAVAKKPAPPVVGEARPALVFQDGDAPSAQAKALTDFLSNTLVQTFRQRGYVALRSAGVAEGKGVVLRGVFAEPDAANRIRRVLLGGRSQGTQFLLYVGTFNLSSQSQPLYQPAPVQTSEPYSGPVITLNNYIPLAKYELTRNPTEDEVRSLCAQIVGNLTSLLSVNPAAFAR